MSSSSKVKWRLNKISRPSNIIFNIMFILILILFLTPVLLVVMISISSESSVLHNGYHFIPEAFSTASYQFLFKGAGQMIGSAYLMSIFVTSVGSFAATLFIALYAYPLTRKTFKGRNVFAFLAFFTTIFGGGLVPWVQIYQTVNLTNSVWILIIPYLLNAWWVIIMRTFMQQSVPDELIEAARIDGAGEFKIFFRVVIPLCKAGLATILLFNLLRYWNDYYLSLVFISDHHLYTIQYYMYQMLSNISYLTSNSNVPAEARKDLPGETARMAIAVVAVGPVIFAYPFFQRYFVKGLVIGAVKG